MGTYGGLFAFLAGSSFVLIQMLGMTRTRYGLAMLTTAFCYFAGTFLCRWMLARIGLRRTLAIAGGMSLAGGTLMATLALAGVASVWAIVPPFCLYMLAHGIHQPCGQSGVTGPFPHAAGTASALNGCLMMLTAFAIGAWMGQAPGGTARPMAYAVWLCAVCVAICAWTLVPRYGEPRSAD
ncbi:MAG TPA: Bcr/CflA family drug resistance efflux transporter, partial [Burkholderiaceae bacterium]